MQMQLHYTNYTTPQLQLHYTTSNYSYSCTTPHYIQQLWVRWPPRWPVQPLQPSKKHSSNHLFGPSVDSLCHPWFTTTNLSSRFSIFETSATALCGTTGISIRIVQLKLDYQAIYNWGTTQDQWILKIIKVRVRQIPWYHILRRWTILNSAPSWLKPSQSGFMALAFPQHIPVVIFHQMSGSCSIHQPEMCG